MAQTVAQIVAVAVVGISAITTSHAGVDIDSEFPSTDSIQSAMWTDADFVLAWGVEPVPGKTSMTLFLDSEVAEALLQRRSDGGDPNRNEASEGAGRALEFECPDVYLLGLQHGAGIGGNPADGAGRGLAEADEFDAVGVFRDAMVVGIPSEHSTVSVDAFSIEYGIVRVTHMDMWIAGTLIGASGVPQHVTGLLGVVLLEGTDVPNGIAGTMIVNPHRTWSRIEDAHDDLSAAALLYAVIEADESSADGDDQSERPTVIERGATDCEKDRASGMWACRQALMTDRAACFGAFDAARVAADAALAGCLAAIDLDARLGVALQGAQIGAICGGAIGVCIGAPLGFGLAGPIGAVGGFGAGATGGAAIGACRGFAWGLVASGATLRARCYSRHRATLAAAVFIRDACLDVASTTHTACVNRVIRRYRNCIAGRDGI